MAFDKTRPPCPNGIYPQAKRIAAHNQQAQRPVEPRREPSIFSPSHPLNRGPGIG